MLVSRRSKSLHVLYDTGTNVMTLMQRGARFLLPRAFTNRAMSTTSSSAAPSALATVSNHETYMSQGISSKEALDPNPLTQFSAWFQHAQQDDSVIEPEAMAVSTVDRATGIPSTRVVLLKRVDESGFVFYTNYESRKGRELFPDGFAADGQKGGFASIAFYWRPLHLSVRVVGRAEKVETHVTEEYFKSRPVGSRIGAWASAQSSALNGGREELDERVKQFEKKFGVQAGTAQGSSAVDAGPGGSQSSAEADIPVPPYWGGVRIVPFEVEFWAGRESRLHDRFRYTRAEGASSEWEIVRLSP